MNLDAWTLLMQGFNFLVLCALLWWFLYRPVQAAIDRRLAEEARVRTETAAVRAEADRRAAELAARLQALATEEAGRLSQASERAAKTIEAAVHQAQDEAARVHARALTDLTGERLAVQSDLRREAGQVALAVAQRVIAPLASAAVHRQLILELQDALKSLPSDRAQAVAAKLAGTGHATLLTSHPISDDERAGIEASLIHAVGPLSRPMETVLDASLLCGVELRLPGLTLAHHWSEQLQHSLLQSVAEVDHVQPV